MTLNFMVFFSAGLLIMVILHTAASLWTLKERGNELQKWRETKRNNGLQMNLERICKISRKEGNK